MKQYLYRIQPTRPAMLTEGTTTEEDAIIGEHFAHLKRLTEDGVMILVGRTLNNDPTTFGIAVFRAESDEAAQAIMHSDPAVIKGVMRAELFPYRVALINEANAAAE
jgi:uncharacterized protein